MPREIPMTITDAELGLLITAVRLARDRWKAMMDARPKSVLREWQMYLDEYDALNDKLIGVRDAVRGPVKGGWEGVEA